MSVARNLARISKQSAIYGAGSIAATLLGIVLLPLYTRELTPAQFGDAVGVGQFDQPVADLRNGHGSPRDVVAASGGRLAHSRRPPWRWSRLFVGLALNACGGARICGSVRGYVIPWGPRLRTDPTPSGRAVFRPSETAPRP